MATVIRDLLVRLGVDANDRAAMNFDRAVQGAKKTMLLASTAAAALGAGLFALTKTVANAGDEAAKTARRLGTTAEAIQELGFVGQITGTSIAEMETSMRRMSRVVSDAANGMASAQDAMDRLGISVEEAMAADPIDLFDQMVGALANVENQTQRSALAQEVFGRSGTRMLTLIDEQGTSIAALRQEARDLGLVMSNDAAAASEEFNDSLARLTALFTGLRNQIAIAFMPAMTAGVNRIREFFQANRAVIEQGIDRVIERIAQAVEKLSAKARDLDALVQSTIGWDAVLTTVLSVITALGAVKFAPVILIAVKAVLSIFTLLGAKLIVIGALFVGFVLVIQDLITWFRGGESVIGSFIERVQSGESRLSGFYQRVMEVVSSLRDFFAPFMEQSMGLFRELGRVAVQIGRLLSMLFTTLFNHARQRVEFFFSYAIPIFEFFAPFVRDIFTNIVAVFRESFATMADILEFLADLFSGEFNSFPEVVEAIMDLITGIFSRRWEMITSMFSRSVETMKNAIRPFSEWVATQLAKAFGPISSAVNFVGNLPGVGRLVGGAAGDQARGNRQQSVQNTALAMGGDLVANINVAGTNASPEEIQQTVGSEMQRLLDRRFRQAAAAFEGSEL